MRDRVQWIDIAKGIGIVLVTLGHTNVRHLLGDYVGWWINAFHMPLFFVMAGLCFDIDRYPGLGRYVLRKIRALAWPYFALAVFMAVLSVVLYWGTDPAWSFWGQIKPFVRGETSVNTFWFIKTLFEVEIVFWLVAKGARKPGWIMSVAIVLGVIGAFVVPEGGKIEKYNTLLVSVFYYALGYVLKDAARMLSAKRSSLLWSMGVGAVVVYSVLIAFCFHYTVGYWGCLLGNRYLFFPLSFLAIFGISVLSMALTHIPYVGASLVWLGINSIVLMAIHGHCGIFRASWVERGFSGIPSIVLEYVLFVVLVWVLAGPLNFLVKFPWGRK